MPKRKRVPDTVQADILTACKRRCCLCYYLDNNTDEAIGQIAHIDHNPSNNLEDNLVWLCLKHHNAYDSTTRAFSLIA